MRHSKLDRHFRIGSWPCENAANFCRCDGFRTPALVRAATFVRAGIRNPSHERTYEPQQRSQWVGLFDHVVGDRKQCRRHGEAERAGGLVVDNQLKLRRLHDRQVRGFRSLEDVAAIDADLAIRIR